MFQNLGDTRTFDGSFTALGARLDLDLKIDPKNEVGFFGGIKLGYVFGTGVVRPTFEGDFFCGEGLRKYVEDLSVTSVSKENAAGWFIKLSAVIGKGLRHARLIGQGRSSLPP